MSLDSGNNLNIYMKKYILFVNKLHFHIPLEYLYNEVY